MTQTHIDGATLRRMMIAGAALLEKQKAQIDALNVFPVPDGDTGTNMSLTMASAVKELRQCEASDVSGVASAVSTGALRGARGNSGVILSQLLRGIARGLKDEQIVSLDTLAKALNAGVEAAYKAVTKPKEGTMLTVSRVVAQAVAGLAETGANLSDVLDAMVSSAEDAVAKTPGQLPVLKEAGVVDAGGKGLQLIYTGFRLAFHGESVPEELTTEDDTPKPLFEDNIAFGEQEELTFAYCTEFFVQQLKDGVDECAADAFKEKLEALGDCVVVILDEGLIKVHVHTNEPGAALQHALELGELYSVKIENMVQQQREMVEKRKASEKEFGIVAVCAGEGFERVFKDLMVDEVVPGGQTMNPSADDLARAIKRVHAHNVFVFPNNKNVVLAAVQAKELSSKNTIVIPSKSLPEGVAGALAFHPDASREENELRMNQALGKVKSGAVTTAIRESKFNGFDIKAGEFIGIMGDEIVSSGSELQSVSKQLLMKMISGDGELVTIFYGDGTTPGQADELINGIRESCSDCDFILQEGGQPIYPYIFSVE